MQDPSLRDNYKTTVNLSYRISLHQRFSTNDIGWHDWVRSRLLVLDGQRRRLMNRPTISGPRPFPWMRRLDSVFFKRIPMDRFSIPIPRIRAALICSMVPITSWI